jgi:N,N'-diacetylbacillosaminyl-diphospho-undecaprenol alpha-1,3-N-acetylgalactosaminyltransferase
MLHTFTAKPNIYGTLAGKMAKVPTIINLVEGLGSFYLEDSAKNIVVRTLIEKLYKLVFLMSDKVVFVNADDPAYLESKGVIKRSQIQVIKSVGIDTAEFDPNLVNKEQIEALRDELQIGSKIVVLMVARAIWHKGVREYYEAAKLLADDKNVQFVLVGDTDEGNPSSADESFLNSGNVLWLGHRDDVLELTAMADIYVLPSYREGVPRTLLEAASMAKPIITTNTVGCREVVKDGKNGFLVTVKNSEMLSKKIEYLLNNVSERNIMGENGRIMAINEFDIQQVVKQYLELYQIVLKKEK